MLRPALWLIALVAFCCGGFFLYRQATQQPVTTAQDASWHSPGAEPGATDSDGNSAALSSPADPATALDMPLTGSAPYTADSSTDAPAEENSSPVYPAAAPPVPTAASSLPATGSDAMAGAGRFHWYQQGDITYRVDTRSGSTCVAFATETEWRRRVVLRHECDAHS